MSVGLNARFIGVSTQKQRERKESLLKRRFTAVGTASNNSRFMSLFQFVCFCTKLFVCLVCRCVTAGTGLAILWPAQRSGPRKVLSTETDYGEGSLPKLTVAYFAFLSNHLHSCCILIFVAYCKCYGRQCVFPPPCQLRLHMIDLSTLFLCWKIESCVLLSLLCFLIKTVGRNPEASGNSLWLNSWVNSRHIKVIT